jgi:hypothetical protein
MLECMASKFGIAYTVHDDLHTVCMVWPQMMNDSLEGHQQSSGGIVLITIAKNTPKISLFVYENGHIFNVIRNCVHLLTIRAHTFLSMYNYRKL